MKQRLKNHFIPHAGNDYKPDALQRAASVAMVALVLLSFALANVQSMFWTNSSWLVGTVLPAVIVDLTNDNRDDGDLDGLKRNTTLDAAATLKAQHMAKNEYFAHFAPDGTSPWYFFDQVSYDFVHAGENLAIHFSDSDDVVEAWMDSPTHRANILNDDFTEIGVGVAKGEFEGEDTVYVVQLFGTPKATAFAAAPQAPVATPAPTITAEITTEPAEESSVAATEITEIAVAPAPEPVSEVTPEPEEVAVVTTEPATLSESGNSETEADKPAKEDAVDEVEVAAEPEESRESQFSNLTTSTADTLASNDIAPVAGSIDSASPAESSLIGRLATSPHTALQLLYVGLALFVIAALMLSVLVEFRRQHPVQIAYGVGQLAVMGGLLYIHQIVTDTVLVISAVL